MAIEQPTYPITVEDFVDHVGDYADTKQDSTAKNAANGYAGLNGSGRVNPTQLGTGTANSGTFLRGDSTYAAIPSDGVAATASLRTLGTGAQQAAAGNDSRLSDVRTPVDGSVTTAKLTDSAVTSAKIADGAVATAELAAGAVTAAKVAADVATTAALDSVRQTVAITNIAGSYTLLLGDAGKVVEIESASSQLLNVPTNAAVPYAIGTVIEVRRQGSGAVNVTPLSGVTIQVVGGSTVTTGTAGSISAQFASVSLHKRSTNTWVLSGSL